jgi:hypothetical protein
MITATVNCQGHHHVKTGSKSKTGMIEQRTFVIEMYKYIKNDGGELYQETKQQAREMVIPLRHPKRTGFHILPCVGFYPDPLHDEIGLVFEAPPRADPNVDFTSLLSLPRFIRKDASCLSATAFGLPGLSQQPQSTSIGSAGFTKAYGAAISHLAPKDRPRYHLPPFWTSPLTGRCQDPVPLSGFLI